jgi:superfamily II DNA or RNA helicase
MVELRGFQNKLFNDIQQAWLEPGVKNVMPVAATGSGKTVVIGKTVSHESGASVAIAHRQELVSQISTAYARNGIRHRLIGSNSALLKAISAIHVFETGYSYYDANSKTAVGGVDTLLRMGDSDPYFKQVRLGVIDEGHHVLKSNKWGKVAAYFPNARFLLPTATPCRADGKGLGRHADGIVDKLVLAPTMREIINMGYLTDYRVFVPPSKIDRSIIEISKTTGDMNVESARKEVRRASITGDIVEHYLKIAKGKLGVTFAVDVEAATDIAVAFRSAGVPAEVVTAKTPDFLRLQILRRFKNRELLQLVNVDLFGEGFDLPALEVVSFARPTMSFSLFCQQFGRVLRLLIPEEYRANFDSYDDATRRAIIAASVKPFGIVIDHVGNVFAHGLPDRFREWTLDRRDSRSSSASTAIPLRVCISKRPEGVPETLHVNKGCGLAYERIHKTCPYCGLAAPLPEPGSPPEFVDGDLTELSPEYLTALRGEIEAPVKIPYNATPQIIAHLRNLHFYKREAREELVNSIAWWAGLQDAQGYNESQAYRLFYFKFGIDVATAQTLNKKEMEGLATRINSELNKAGIDPTINAMEFLK